VLGQMLGNSNSATGSSPNSGASPGNNTTVATSGQGSATAAVSSAGLPSVQSGILDTTPSIHSLSTVSSFSPPALDLQGGNAVLPPVQALGRVQQDIASGPASIPLNSPAIPLALSEPASLVLLVAASVAYLGGGIGRRLRRVPAS
jgi:hypothetical protein